MAHSKKFKKDDKVVVITGRDKGKTGEIFEVSPADFKVKVRGVNLFKKHQKPSQVSQGGIVQKEAWIHMSNVAHIDPKDSKPVRVGFKFDGDRKVRFAKRSSELLDK